MGRETQRFRARMRIAVEQQPIVVPGFRFAGVHCGLKEDGRRDIGLIASERPAAAAAVFTTNRVRAAPVEIGRERARRGVLQAIVVNSGNANAYTGREGRRIAREMTRLVARYLGLQEELVLPSSTGKIGIPMPREIVLDGVAAACTALSPGGFYHALEGMMTTDAFPKFAVERAEIEGRTITVAGMAKGAGMIAPRMATMLAYVLSDAAVTPGALRRVLRGGLSDSFNAIVVDGDMSTNDTVVLLANGVASNRLLGPGSRSLSAFAAAVHRVMRALARMIVKDGEGATKVVDVHVRGARTAREAARVADTIARSPLCKTAFFGGDPYAGRFVCAIGYSGARFDPAKLEIRVNGIALVRRGVVVGADAELRAAKALAAAEFALTIDLHAGRGVAYRMASDLTTDYVTLNSAYRT